MSAVKEIQNAALGKNSREAVRSASSSFVTRALTFLSSVRFGIILLILLVLASMTGMLIMQENVAGFDKYFAELTPAQQLIWSKLGFFDIYHTWYFNALLLVLSINIILASIDRFPNAWTFISSKKLDASRKWLIGQVNHEWIDLGAREAHQVADLVAKQFDRAGLKSVITEKGGGIFVFGERGAWNRLGAYAVHVALLAIFAGGFLTAQFGREGQMRLEPGNTNSQLASSQIAIDPNTERLLVGQTNIPLPFSVTCTDIQQKLIRPEGSILADNTLDWLTRIKIRDEYGEREALVHLNEPYDYRGYRFFQASYISNGKARNVELKVTPASGAAPFSITVPRNGATTLPDGTRVALNEFSSEFTVGGDPPKMGSAEYGNPVAILGVNPASANAEQQAYAFPMDLPDNVPVAKPVAGYRFKLVDFEKVPEAHVLSVKHDPGRAPFYLGGLLLIITLGGVFFFSHQRFWARITKTADGYTELVIAGNTNRNKLAFEDRFKALTKSIRDDLKEVEER
jgi:cytochrome c biogenesis protein